MPCRTLPDRRVPRRTAPHGTALRCTVQTGPDWTGLRFIRLTRIGYDVRADAARNGVARASYVSASDTHGMKEGSDNERKLSKMNEDRTVRTFCDLRVASYK